MADVPRQPDGFSISPEPLFAFRLTNATGWSRLRYPQTAH